MNSLNLFGRLTKKPVLKTTASGDKACYFNLAVSRARRRARNGEEKEKDTPRADFIPCVAYRKLAETFIDYLDKGDRIVVEGRLQSYNVKTQEGVRTRLICVVDRFGFAGDAKNSNSDIPQEEQPRVDVPDSGMPADSHPEIADEDLPF